MRRTLAVLFAAGIAGLAATAVAHGLGNRAGASSSCKESWTSAASGRPIAGTSHTGIFLWRTRGFWYLGFGSAPSSGVGRVSADAPVRVASATPTLRSGLAVTSRGMTFRTPAGGGFLTFRAACATKLTFSFARTGAGATKPAVFLGRTSRSVSPSFVLTRTLTTGVMGRVFLAAGCPVVKIGQTCGDPKPIHSAVQVRIESVSTSKTGGGQPQLVKTITTDADGSYTTTLAPGRYLLTGVGKPPGGTVFTPSVVTVAPGVVAVADLYIDSGIR